MIAAVAATLAATARSATPYVIYGDSRIGPFQVQRGKLATAIKAFGTPSAIRHVAGSQYLCETRWKPVGLRLTFYVLGGSSDACVPEQGCFRNALITGPRWRTAKGLRIGDSRARLAALYPAGASKLRGAWWPLLIRPFPEELGGPYPALEAKLHQGRVTAFRIVALTCGI